MIVRELTAKLGLNIDGAAFGMADAAINGLRNQFLKVGLVMGGVATAVAAAVGSTARAASEIEDLHQRTGIARGSLQELKHAAQQVGVSFEGLVQGVTLMTRNAVEASQGSKEAAANFAAIGIDPTLFKSSDDLLGAVADKIQGLVESGQGMKATAVAMDIFGRSGSQLIPLLKGGRGGIQAFREEAQRLGLVMSDDLVKRGDEWGDAMDKLGGALSGVRNAFAGVFLKAAPVIEAMALWIGRNRELIATFFGLSLAAGLVWALTVAVGFAQSAMMGLAFWAGMSGFSVAGLAKSFVQLALRSAWALTNLMLTEFAFGGIAKSALAAAASVMKFGWSMLKSTGKGVATGLMMIRGLFTAAGRAAAMAGLQAARAWIVGLGPIWLLIGGVLLFLAALAGVIAVVQDFWVAINGGQSVFGELGRMIREAFAPAMKWIEEKWNALWDWMGAKGRAILDGVTGFFSFGADASAGDFGSAFGGGASPTASALQSPGTGKNQLQQNAFSSNIVINPPPGTSAAAIAGETVDRQGEFMSTRLQEAHAAS